VTSDWKRDLKKVGAQLGISEFDRRKGKITKEKYLPDQELIQRAKDNPPFEAKNTASGFSDWVFGLTHPNRTRSPQSLNMGIRGQERIREERRKNRTIIKNYTKISGYELIFEDKLNDVNESFTASKLQIEGKPIKCKPDIVLERKSTNEILIIEIKCTETKNKIPTSAWPNVQAQLWCYSWIDDWVNSNVILMADIRRIDKINFTKQQIHHTRAPRWRRDESEFNELWSLMFKIYGGDVNID
jgi:hypothetical protein